MTITAANIKAGPVLLTLGGTELGGTTGPITWDYGRGIKEIPVSDLPGAFEFIQTGEGQMLHVKGTLRSGMTATIRKLLWPETVQAGDTQKFGRVPGHSLQSDALALTVHPIRDGAVVTSDGHVYRAVNIASAPIIYDGDNPIDIPFDFVAMPDESKSNGNYLADIGVTADVAAPTLTTIVPSDGASAQLGTVAIVITFNEAMSKSSLVDDLAQARCVTVYDETNDAYVACAAVVTTVTNANDTLTITPDSALTASATIRIILSESARDLNANSFAGADYSFAVAA